LREDFAFIFAFLPVFGRDADLRSIYGGITSCRGNEICLKLQLKSIPDIQTASIH
jgi:hypothetical protein